MAFGVGACNGDDGQASASESASGTSTGGETTTTTGESEAGSASESDTSTTSGASEGQTNTTDPSGSESNSMSGTSTTTDTESGTGTGMTTESGGGSGGTSTTTTTGQSTQCAEYEDQKSCNADPKCQAILGTVFEYIVSAWCLGDEAYLGCVEIGESCGGEPYTVCKGDVKYQLVNQCPPPDAMICDPPPGGPEFKECG